MKYIIDASVAVKWIVKEKHSQNATLYLHEIGLLYAPDFIKIEIANAIIKKVKGSEIQKKNGWESYCNLFQSNTIQLIKTEEMVDRSYDLAVTINHSFYDCLYLATAESIDAIVVTADQKFYNRVTNHKQFTSLIRWIEIPPDSQEKT